MWTPKAGVLSACLFYILTLSGCAGPGDYTRPDSPIQQNLERGDLGAAFQYLPLPHSGTRSEVLLRLERGALLQYLGRFRESSAEFGEAVSAMRTYERRATISLERTATLTANLLLSEAIGPYTGEAHEKVLVHTLDAINYLMLGDLEGARVEVRNAYALQRVLTEKHRQSLERARQDAIPLGLDLRQGLDNPGLAGLKVAASNAASVYQNAFASYISAVVYEMQGEDDEAYIDLKQAIESAPQARVIQHDLIRLSRRLGFRDEAAAWEQRFGIGEESTGEVVIYLVLASGLAPVKEELKLPIPLHSGVVFIALPTYRFRPASVTGALLNGAGTTTPASTLLDIDALASRVLLDELPLLLVRQAVRTSLKAQATRRLYEEYGVIGALSATLASALTEQADLRTWSTLPKQIHVARLCVPAGTATVDIQALPRGNTRTIEIPPDARTLLALVRCVGHEQTLFTKAF